MYYIHQELQFDHHFIVLWQLFQFLEGGTLIRFWEFGRVVLLFPRYYYYAHKSRQCYSQYMHNKPTLKECITTWISTHKGSKLGWILRIGMAFPDLFLPIFIFESSYFRFPRNMRKLDPSAKKGLYSNKNKQLFLLHTLY